MANITKTLTNAAAVLEEHGVAEARREAALLLEFALQKDKIFLFARTEYELSAEEQTHFDEVINRRARREPFQYIVGKQEFYGLDFEVTKDVLIPRPETEMIVENAIEFLQNESQPTFCEIGIGSGCIAVSILHTLTKAQAVGLDISAAALEIARRNANAHQVAKRLELRISDVYANAPNEIYDAIVSNPPYIPLTDIENLQSEVRDFEPLKALTDKADGLSIISKIISGAPQVLKPNGLLLIEIGINQAPAVERLFDPNLWQTIDILPDFQNIPRMIRARKNFELP